MLCSPLLFRGLLRLSLKREMLRFLIGKAGSELRHIQNNYKAGAKEQTWQVQSFQGPVTVSPHLPGKGEHSS